MTFYILRAHLFENIFIITFRNPSVSPHAGCESNNAHR